MTAEEHRERHKLLHSMLDELIADYLLANRGALPSKNTIRELMDWSYEQTLKPRRRKMVTGPGEFTPYQPYRPRKARPA